LTGTEAIFSSFAVTTPYKKTGHSVETAKEEIYGVVTAKGKKRFSTRQSTLQVLNCVTFSEILKWKKRFCLLVEFGRHFWIFELAYIFFYLFPAQAFKTNES
jgi:hypothetical protein